MSAEPLNSVLPDFVTPEVQPLKYKVHGRPAFAAVTVFLGDGEQVVGDGGSLLWMDGDIDANAFCAGGCISSCRRSFSGESCYFVRYTGPGYVTFGFDDPGDMLAFAVTPEKGWILTQRAFVAGSPDLLVTSRFAGCCTCQIADEGAFFTKVNTEEPLGVMFAGGFGEIVRHNIPSGKILFVDNGLFFAAHDKTRIRMQIFGGLRACLCNQEGLVMSFYGPNVVYTQSRDPLLLHMVTEGA